MTFLFHFQNWFERKQNQNIVEKTNSIQKSTVPFLLKAFASVSLILSLAPDCLSSLGPLDLHLTSSSSL